MLNLINYYTKIYALYNHDYLYEYRVTLCYLDPDDYYNTKYCPLKDYPIIYNPRRLFKTYAKSYRAK